MGIGVSDYWSIGALNHRSFGIQNQHALLGQNGLNSNPLVFASDVLKICNYVVFDIFIETLHCFALGAI